MKDVNLKTIKELKNFIEIVFANRALLDQFSLKENSFMRNRKLPFEKLVLLITKLCKKTLSVEIEEFFNEFEHSGTYSVSSFSQQRIKLNPLFFYYWNQVLLKSFYTYAQEKVKRWKGYRLIAVDGSNVSLINNHSLRTAFGGQSNQHAFFVQAKALYYYDILNELVVDSIIAPYQVGELSITYNKTDNLEQDTIAIYDRNFCNYKMIALHLWQETERKFVIRGNENHNWIKTFIKSGNQEDIVSIKPTNRIIEGLRQSGFVVNADTAIKVRLIRVELNNGRIEVLITNLLNNEGFKKEEFKDLYAKRWSVETNIAIQKNIMQLEAFSGLTEISVKQDFYATVIVANLHSLLIKEAQETAQQQYAYRKHPVKINNNKSFGRIKRVIVELFVCENPEKILETLHEKLIREVLPVRKDRSYPRVVKNKQSKSKHKTFT
ncbi:MAG TPA: IS4 family transposase, partial [Bacteroidia bacterium]|nr:IS4 family transposase [Bacteroidia bacterium]